MNQRDAQNAEEQEKQTTIIDNYCLIKEGYNDYSLQPFYLQIKICNYNLF